MQSNDDFIDSCIEKGITTPTLICEAAVKEMKEIEKVLHEADLQRMRYNSLKQLIKEFSPAQKTERKKEAFKNTTFEMEQDDSDASMVLRAKICEIVEQGIPLTNREIIQKLGADYYSQDAEVFKNLKVLGAKGIIKRNDEHKLVQGENWLNRI